jgi:hypothetical protein
MFWTQIMLLSGFFSYIMKKNIFFETENIFLHLRPTNFKFFFALVCELRLKLQKFTQADPRILRKLPSISL